MTHAEDTDGRPLRNAQAALSALATITLSDHSFADVLQKISELAKTVVPGASEVSMTLLEGDEARTIACTGELAEQLDERQYERGYGPCMAAASTGAVVRIDDMATEKRWAGWVKAASTAGAQSSLSLPVPVLREVSAAMNIYSTEPHAFDEESETLATTFSSYAGVALANAHLFEAQARVAAQLQEAMTSRAVIDQARGIIMADRRCTADEAFNVLVELSQRSNKKLRVIAQALVDETARSR